MDKITNFFVDKNVMYLAQSMKFTSIYDIPPEDFYLLHIDNVCYDEQAPKKEALENVLSSLNIEGINFIFLIVGQKEKVDFYYGISRDICCKKKPRYSIQDIGKRILLPAIQGNFRGSRVRAVPQEQGRDIHKALLSMEHLSVIEGVPGANKDDEKYQGIDRLVNVMYGDSYCFLVVANPLETDQIIEVQEGLYKLYDKIAPLSKLNIQTGNGINTGTSDSETSGSSTTSGSTNSKTTTTGTASSCTDTTGTNFSATTSVSKSSSSNGSNSSTSASGSESKTEGNNASKSKQNGENRSLSNATGQNHSSTSSESKTIGTSSSRSESTTSTKECVNRQIQDIIHFMDDILFPRLDYGKGKGTFLTSMCVFAEDKISLQKIKSTVTALYAGESGNKIPLQAFDVPHQKNQNVSSIHSSFASFQLPAYFYNYWNKKDEDKYLAHCFMRHVISKIGTSTLGNWITTNELGMIAGLPQKEVVGLSLNEEVEFGLNCTHPEEEDRIYLGSLIQNGNVLQSPIYLNKKDLDKHIFVAGVTGSGKTTTCQRILTEADIPFLVIEPAKTEYRVMIDHHPDLLVFTLGDNQTTPLRMNPLMFYPGESITSRVDMLCACIESAFDMEAAIPQIIEQALYKSYEEKGWNIYTNRNNKYKNPFDGTGKAFPMISDLIMNCKRVVEEQGFDERLKNDYIGSINARLLGLTSGGKGFLLNTQNSVDFIELLDQKVVFELENIRSSAEKSLIMGFILINLVEAIREKYKVQNSKKIQHITLVEEAHRLLSKHSPGDSPSKKQSVEMFSDMLAEIRKYGESLMIVDQIPNKLTPDVLKNTNTKIIHRIFATDDKEAVGNTVMLQDEQKEFLSNLQTGRAVYFTTGTEKAVQIQVEKMTDTSSQTPSDEKIRERMATYYIKHYAKCLYMGLELFREQPTLEQFACIRELNQGCVNDWHFEFQSNSDTLSANTRKSIQRIIDAIGLECLGNYMNRYENAPKLRKYIIRYFE